MEDGSPSAVHTDPFDLFFPQHQGSNADDDDASPPGSYSAASNYSSCDGEGSELDRYCSANSALGSASLCSSVGNHGDLLDLPDAASWERFCRSSDEGGIASPREKGLSHSQLAVALLDRVGSLPRIRTPSRLLPAFTNRPGESAQLGVVQGQQEVESAERRVVDFSACNAISAGRGDAIPSQNSLPCKIASGEEVDPVGNLGSSASAENRSMVDVDEDASSGYEHSEGENSMFEYGTDCENSTGRYGKSNSRYIDRSSSGNVNPLVMNSSVAFGSDDLDELLQENGNLDLQCLSSAFQPSVYENGERKVPLLSINHVNDVDEKEDSIDEILHKDKFLHLESTVESQSMSTHKVSKGDIPSITNGIIVNVDMHGVANKRMPCESGSTDHYVAIESSSISPSVSQSEKGLHREHDNQRSCMPVIAAGENSSFQIELNNTSKIKDLAEDDIVTNEIKKQNPGDLYDEMVMEMEEILLDTGKSSGTKSGGNHEFLTHQSHHIRDGSSTASTSGTDDIYAPAQYHSRIDWVEVVGAKQRVGDVSFGERLVGVKEYTIYVIKVLSANDQWEVERRYRDFFALYQQLRTLFFDHGLSLPSQWASIDRESMKIFGNVSPIVVSKRSALIQDCLRSVLNSEYSFGFPSPLLCFLSPGKLAYSSSFFKSLVPQSLQKIGEGWSSITNVGDSPEDISELGKMISLVVDIKPHKSTQQLLELQHYTCAGCHKHMDAGKTLLRELVQTLAWKKPRYCEYTGQLFCSSCHTNDTSVVPAKVLHLWDFSLYPVSQLAKAYLESIYDQPMLCVSAKNPLLFSKVPALLHIMGIRKRIAAMFPYIRCPFRISIQRGLGSRRHLLESNDFFALRDLVDLSKGAFAALPIMLETVSNKILEHITQQCLVCYDSGVPCAARQVCDDPLSLIFPFQEAEAAKCSLCDSIFHKPCLLKMITCSCGNPTSAPGTQRNEGDRDNTEPFDGLVEPTNSSSTSNLFSNMLLKARPDRIWKPKNRSPVILMGSLPNTSL